jgi:hypothetical protein
MGERASSPNILPGADASKWDADAGQERLVSVALDDSWSTLEREIELIDRLFGGEFAALFGEHGNGTKRHVRG